MPSQCLLEQHEIIDGAYEVRALLGEGGMGQVYEAQDLVLNRRVAIKVPWPHAAESLRDEAQALAALHSPCVPTVHRLGTHRGIDYLVMERVYGVTLADHAKLRRASSPFEIREAIEILARIAEGLAAVHGAGLAHRDIKPSNILLAPHDRVVLVDFGIFHAPTSGEEARPICGSPWYMAPEAIASSVEAGQAFLVDVYAFGIVAFELLTGRVPFDGNALRVLSDQLGSPPPDLETLRPDAPPRLAALVRDLLAKHPDDRPQSMDAVVWRLREILRGPEAHPRRLTVVIAEDNQATAMIITELILSVRPDAEILVAPDGRRALDLLRTRSPHLLLLDLNLPRMSGVEICMYLRGAPESARGCSIVAVSAAAHPDDVELLRRLGFASFIPKGDALAARLPRLVEDVARRVNPG